MSACAGGVPSFAAFWTFEPGSATGVFEVGAAGASSEKSSDGRRESHAAKQSVNAMINEVEMNRKFMVESWMPVAANIVDLARIDTNILAGTPTVSVGVSG
jgi:hypothetical protein